MLHGREHGLPLPDGHFCLTERLLLIGSETLVLKTLLFALISLSTSGAALLGAALA